MLRHGHKTDAGKSPEYQSWSHAKSRCNNQRDIGFADYGGRGIRVCDRWLHFDNFLADMGLKPTPAHSLDRKDTNGPYAPENCRWATTHEQTRNKRSNHNLTHDGITLILSDWARRIGMKRTTLERRLYTLGWSVSDALTIAVKQYQRR